MMTSVFFCEIGRRTDETKLFCRFYLLAPAWSPFLSWPGSLSGVCGCSGPGQWSLMTCEPPPPTASLFCIDLHLEHLLPIVFYSVFLFVSVLVSCAVYPGVNSINSNTIQTEVSIQKKLWILRFILFLLLYEKTW